MIFLHIHMYHTIIEFNPFNLGGNIVILAHQTFDFYKVNCFLMRVGQIVRSMCVSNNS